MQSSPEAATSEADSRTQLVSVEKVSVFGKVRREVSEDEFTSPGVPRILLEQNEELRAFRDRFHEADKDRAILREKLKLRVSAEITSVLGSLLIGFSASLWSSWPYGLFALSFGLLLLAAGIITPLVASRK